MYLLRFFYKSLWLICGSLLILGPGSAFAGDSDIVFPTTQKDIESALAKPALTRGLPKKGPKAPAHSATKGVGGVADDHQIPEPRVGAMINFDLDSATIRSESYPLLDEFGKALTGGLWDAVLIIAGHTDSTGPEEYNQNLSVERANSVANYLIGQHNIDSKRLIVKGFGEHHPIADNRTSEGRFKNRRVEFIRTK